MSDHKAILIRTSDDGVQTLGRLLVFELNTVIFECKTLELSYKDNQRNISCIPDGIYNVEIRTSEKYGKHYHIKDVPNRSFILFHAGNYNSQIRGCVLVGTSFRDINNDGKKDVIYSKYALGKMLNSIGNFKLEIKSIFNNKKK